MRHLGPEQVSAAFVPTACVWTNTRQASEAGIISRSCSLSIYFAPTCFSMGELSRIKTHRYDNIDWSAAFVPTVLQQTGRPAFQCVLIGRFAHSFFAAAAATVDFCCDELLAFKITTKTKKGLQQQQKKNITP